MQMERLETQSLQFKIPETGNERIYKMSINIIIQLPLVDRCLGQLDGCFFCQKGKPLTIS